HAVPDGSRLVCLWPRGPIVGLRYKDRTYFVPSFLSTRPRPGGPAETQLAFPCGGLWVARSSFRVHRKNARGPTGPGLPRCSSPVISSATLAVPSGTVKGKHHHPNSAVSARCDTPLSFGVLCTR